MPYSEAECLRALLQYEVLDTPEDPALDSLTALAARLSGAPYAYIGFLDANRLWLKSASGFAATEFPREQTACQFTVRRSEALYIPDAIAEPALKFLPRGIPLGEAGYCLSYLGAPLLASGGVAIGTLAVLAPEPDAFSDETAADLEVLAEQVVTRLELYLRNRSHERSVRARQRVERALTVERNFVSAILDTISAQVLVQDTAGRIVRFNRACERLSGYSFAELVGRPIPEDFFLPEERQTAGRLFDTARRGQQPEPCELHWISRDGQRHRIAWTTTNLTDSNGEVTFIITTGVDVTEQRQAEAALRGSEARYRQLIEGSLGMICTHDLEGRLLSINTHAAHNLGFEPEELIGQFIRDFIPADHKQGWARYWDAIRNLGEDQGLLYLHHRNGGMRIVAYRNKLINLPGAPPFVLGHGIDVTEKTETENKVHNLMRQRESILESVGDGIYGMDLSGKIVFVNQVGANMLGYTPEEVEGRDMHSLVHHTRADGSPYPVSECPIYESGNRQSAVRMRDEIFWRKDGAPIPVEYVACPLITNGKSTGTVVAFQDVTERRRLDRMKDEFISTVSHELRTPLTSLRAALGLISSGVLDNRPEKSAQMLDVAIGNCDRLVRLVNDILDFERINSGKVSLVYSQVDARQLLLRAADLQRSSATRAGIALKVDVPPSPSEHIPGEPISLWIDNDRILQTLTNLLGNAIKFSPPGSEIVLRARILNGWEAALEVQDQGRGIPPEKLDIIFERFQQVDASDSRAMGGTGLGLAICRSIVAQHGGRIWAESTLGVGSTFSFTVPRYRGSAS